MSKIAHLEQIQDMWKLLAIGREVMVRAGEIDSYKEDECPRVIGKLETLIEHARRSSASINK